MIKPLCPLCATRHTSTEFCSALGGLLGEVANRRTDKAMAREPIDEPAGGIAPFPQGHADLPPPLKASRDGKRVVQPAAAKGGQHESAGIRDCAGVTRETVSNVARKDDLEETTEDTGPPTFAPMTQAERSRKHYAANKEKRQLANKLRMRRNRDG